MRKDEDIVNEIMEAGYGYGRESSVLGTAAHFGAKIAAKGLYKGVKAGVNAYQNSAGVQMQNQTKLRNAVYHKLNTDFAHWQARVAGSTGVEPTEDNLLTFAREVYGFDASKVLSTIRTDQKIQKAAPAPAAGGTKGAPKAAAPKAAAPKAAAKPANPNVVQHDKEGKPFYKHNSKGINFDDPTLNDPTTSPITTNQQRNQQRFPEKKPAAPAKKTRKESVDLLSMSFSQIVTEAEAKFDDTQMHAFFDGLARTVLGNPQAAQNFLQTGQLSVAPEAAQAAPAAAGAAKAAPAAAPAANPTKAAPAAPAGGVDGKALKAELNKIITSQMGVKIDKATIQGIVAKLKESPNLKGVTDFVDSPAEIEAARAILIAVIIATEM
jgi:hypothetical protein